MTVYERGDVMRSFEQGGGGMFVGRKCLGNFLISTHQN